MSIPTAFELARRMKQEIIADIQSGKVDGEKVASFADLHDYVDANMYGNTDELMGAMVPGQLEEKANEKDLQAFCDLVNSATNLVDEWIKRGGHTMSANFNEITMLFQNASR